MSAEFDLATDPLATEIKAPPVMILKERGGSASVRVANVLPTSSQTDTIAPAGSLVPPWLLRLLFMVPFAVLLGLASHLLGSTVNAAFATRMSHLNFGEPVAAGWMRGLYPPLGILIGLSMPGGAVGLSALGVIIAGMFLFHMYSVMIAEGWNRLGVTLLLVAMAASPVFVDLVLGDLLGLLALVFFSLGMLDMYRFVTERHTDAGFRAGVWFLLCSLVSTSGLLLVGLAFITAPFLGVARWRDYGARLTNLAVLFFPVISVFAAVSLLQGVFFRDPFALFAPAFQYDEARWRVLRDMFVAPNGWAMILITIAGILACFAIGRRRTALLPLLVVIVIMYGKVFGIVPQNDVGYSMLALIMVIVALWYRLPSQKDLPRAIFIFAALTAAIFWGSIIIAAPGTSVLGSLLAGTR